MQIYRNTYECHRYCKQSASATKVRTTSCQQYYKSCKSNYPEDVVGLVLHDHLVVTQRSLPLLESLGLSWSRSIGAQSRSVSLMLMSGEVCFILLALSLLPIARGLLIQIHQMLRSLAFLSKVIVTITLEASLVAVVTFRLRNAFTLVVEVSPRLTELLPLTTRMVSRMTTRVTPPSPLSDMHFRQRSSTRRSLL